MGVNTFYIGCPIIRQLNTGSNIDYLDPDYWLFGRNIPMNKYLSGSYCYYMWAVKYLSNPIEVIHNSLNNFSIKVKFALVY